MAREFDTHLAPQGFVAVRTGSKLDSDAYLCNGCAFNYNERYEGLCWNARCAPWTRPDESHAIFVEET